MKPKKKKQQAQQPQASTFQIPFDPPVVDSSALRTIPYVLPPDNMYGEDLSARTQAVMPFIQQLYSMPSVREKIAQSMNQGYGSRIPFEDYMEEAKFRVETPDQYPNPQQVAFMNLLDMYPNSNPSSYEDMAELYAKHMSDPMSFHFRTGRPSASRDRDNSLGYIKPYHRGLLSQPGSSVNPMYMGLGHIMNRGNYGAQVDDDAQMHHIVHESTHAGDAYVNADYTERIDPDLTLTTDEFLNAAKNFRSKYIDIDPNEDLSTIGWLEDKMRDEDAARSLRYYNSPPEILARLNAIRYLLKDRAMGNYSLDDLKAIYTTDDWFPYNREDVKSNQSALQELRTLYSDEDIVRLLNEFY